MIKKINENPTIFDSILLNINTPNADGCYLENPYKIDYIKIYFVPKNYNNVKKYKKDIFDESIKSDLDILIQKNCNNPSEENIKKINNLKDKLNQSLVTTEFYFSDPICVKVIGDEENPAWMSTDLENTQLNRIEKINGELVYGRFEYIWEPIGLREGDYFICYSWTPNIAGDKLTDHIHLHLLADIQNINTLPTNYTKENKYNILLERYLPSLFKNKISNNDVSPEILNILNKSVADGFTHLENQVLQIPDLLDANNIHESLLPYLGNFFDKKLYSEDPTLWRRQIKNSIPYYKMKGTLKGLEVSLSEVGVNLKKFVQLWQIQSKFKYQECFKYLGENIFKLENTPVLPIDANYKVHYLLKNEDNWHSTENFNVYEDNNSYYLEYNDSLENIQYIKILYPIDLISESQQEIEEYIENLPLLDNRDHRNQEYPIKNWNLKIIEEDDPFFNLIVNVKNPLSDNIIYGKLRTEFPYSENLYNTEEYNGSIRDSYNPCDIDKDFIDKCHSCISSSYILDLEIEKISNDRIMEIMHVIKNFTPSHSVLHSVNLSSLTSEFVKPALETIKILIKYSKEDFVLSDNANLIFNRLMLQNNQITRNNLTDSELITSSSGIAFNEFIKLYSPNVNFNGIGINNNYNILEILSPSINSGIYRISSLDGNYAIIEDFIDFLDEPIDEESFTYNLSNLRLTKTSASIQKNNEFIFYDLNQNFILENIKTQKEETPWKIFIQEYSSFHEIKDIVNNKLIIENDLLSSLPIIDTENLNYSLYDNFDNLILESLGNLKINKLGKIQITGSVTINGEIQEYTNNNDFFNTLENNNLYLKYNNVQYKISKYDENYIYIESWNNSDIVGIEIQILNRILDKKIGYLNYSDLWLTTSLNYENILQISNGDNNLYAMTRNNFKENYLIVIDSEYYNILSINNTEMKLDGPMKNWGTIDGTSVDFDIIKYSKKENITIPKSNRRPKHEEHTFEYIDNSSTEVIVISEEENLGYSILNNNNENNDNIYQKEKITFKIEKV